MASWEIRTTVRLTKMLALALPLSTIRWFFYVFFNSIVCVVFFYVSWTSLNFAGFYRIVTRVLYTYVFFLPITPDKLFHIHVRFQLLKVSCALSLSCFFSKFLFVTDSWISGATFWRILSSGISFLEFVLHSPCHSGCTRRSDRGFDLSKLSGSIEMGYIRINGSDMFCIYHVKHLVSMYQYHFSHKPLDILCV